jgi:hypothetical protein
MHLFTEVLVKDESQNVIPEIISSHLSSKGVSDVPELLFEFFVVSHIFLYVIYYY